MCEKVVSILERLVQKDPTNNGLQRDLGVSLDDVALIYYGLGEGKKALKYYMRSLEIKRLLVEKEPKVVDRHIGLAIALLDMFRVTKDEEGKRGFVMVAYRITKSLVDSGVNHPELSILREIFSL